MRCRECGQDFRRRTKSLVILGVCTDCKNKERKEAMGPRVGMKFYHKLLLVRCKLTRKAKGMFYFRPIGQDGEKLGKAGSFPVSEWTKYIGF